MNISEKDIDFQSLLDKQFEELCFDLLWRLGYKGLIWRQGGADSGRDIEGRLNIDNSLVDTYDEKWFFECKCHKNGIPTDVINSKIAWADAEKPRHFVIFVSSYLTNNTRAWIEKISQNKPYIIHVIEGKRLKQILLRFPDLVNNYFLDEYTKLLLEARKSWLIHDLLPDLNTISLLINKIELDKLSVKELSFLWCVGKIRTHEILHLDWPDSCEQFYMDILFKDVAKFVNTSVPLIFQKDDLFIEYWSCGLVNGELTYPNTLVARLILNKSTNPKKALYILVSDNDNDEGLEVLIEATGDFPAKVRHIEKNAKDEIHRINKIFIATETKRNRELKAKLRTTLS